MNNNKIHIGTSGWSYKDWRGVFYEKAIQPKDYLPHYAKSFNTVEIDSTYYGIPRPATVERWFSQTPDSFIFSPKTPQIITHDKRLINCAEEWGQFITTMKLLGHKLGPVVLQFDYQFEMETFFKPLESFLENHSSEARLSVEIRHKSWHHDKFYQMLKAHKTGLALNDIYYMPRVTELTANFTYIRLLGNRRQIPDDFSHIRVNREKDLDWWTKWIEQCLEKELEVYVYSNNRYQGHAPATIRALIERLQP